MHTLSLGWGVAQGVQAGHLPRDRPSPTLSLKAVQQVALIPPNQNHTQAWASPDPESCLSPRPSPGGKCGAGVLTSSLIGCFWKPRRKGLVNRDAQPAPGHSRTLFYTRSQKLRLLERDGADGCTMMLQATGPYA